MTEKRILVFGGTVEGRRISDYLKQNGIYHTVCVATEYGEEVLSPSPYLEIRQGRMDTEQMCSFLTEGRYQAVVDATHPYAVEVSANIRTACSRVSPNGKDTVPYLRFLRTNEQSGQEADCIYVGSAQEAAGYLETQKGGIFLTTGSKELSVFAGTISDKTRLFARVLPSSEVIASCRALGLEGKQICGMQGPFSADMNEAMMRQAGSAFLVTKDTGASGGFPEKLEAAARLGVKTVVIRRPEETGYSFSEVTKQIGQILSEEDRWDAPKQNDRKNADAQCPAGPETDVQAQSGKRRKISCVGIGMGTAASLTHEAAGVIRNADIVFGAKRILEITGELFPDSGSEASKKRPVLVCEYAGEKIASYLKEHPQYENIAVLMSGDVGFYSGARGIEQAFPGEKVDFYCGISSVVYFASKIPTAWQDARLLSAHGKPLAVLNNVKRYPKLILLVSGGADVARISRELCGAGLSEVRVTVGVDLSYPREEIRRGAASDFLAWDRKGLHIMMVENPQASHVLTPGIPDEAFTRGKVPMTKEEVRILSVAKLRLKENAVVYDVGAGTGSVAAEIARLCTDGAVYAIEKNPEGIRLIRENARNMGLSNLTAVEGTAPAAFEGLPAPGFAFIGGSSGNMQQIIESLREKNPHVRIVINTIALESIAEVTALLEKMEIRDADIVQVSAARSRTLGRYHMMTGLNPVYIISFGG